jgi:hypothetical protein
VGDFPTGIVVAKIEQVVGAFGSEEKNEEDFLLKFFCRTLVTNLKQRSLDVLQCLHTSLSVDER